MVLPVLFVAEIVFIYLIKHRKNMVLWGIIFAVIATLIAVFLSKTELFKENPMKTYKKYVLIIPKVCFALSFISLGYTIKEYFKIIKKILGIICFNRCKCKLLYYKSLSQENRYKLLCNT